MKSEIFVKSNTFKYTFSRDIGVRKQENEILIKENYNMILGISGNSLLEILNLTETEIEPG